MKDVASVEPIHFARRFTGTDWDLSKIPTKIVNARITAPDGKVTYEQLDVEAPEGWSQNAINIVSEKYFRVINGVNETSVKQLVKRVAGTIASAGVKQGVFTAEVAAVFEAELSYLLINQMFAFNSPVWFNIGVPGAKQQASACFINHVDDNMESITDLAATEVRLFKGGSGAGVNISNLRSSYEKLSGGGSPSGPVSFMKMFDAGAGVTKSGGTTRRAAKMVVMNVDHPDILEQANGEAGFIRCKTEAERVAQALIAGGFSSQFNKPGNAYDYSPFQNANNSVRVTNDFMRSVESDGTWTTKMRTTKEVVHTYKAKELWQEIAKAAWASGDPGIQFDTTTNEWHTLPGVGPITASNPCSEFLHLDNTSCNLGSFNLLKFLQDDEFAVARFVHAVCVCITAMEILVEHAEYPTLEITAKTRSSRPLGVGYANLGTLLMVQGIPYDSEEGRTFAASITSLMTAVGYEQSQRLARVLGSFEYYENNRAHMSAVINKHRLASSHLTSTPISSMAHTYWNILVNDKNPAFRNSQISVLAPTGTIGFMMDCDTTGCEPMLAITQYKKLVGGGTMVIPSRSVIPALQALGYTAEERLEIVKNIEKHGELNAPDATPIVSDEDLRVFQTAIGSNPLSTSGHLKMMGAIQPFLSGGISKTVNMPNSATVEEVGDVYMEAWKLGLKCVAIYRDGCKASQPASAKKTETVAAKMLDAAAQEDLKAAITKTIHAYEKHGPEVRLWGERKRLDDERMSVTHKFSVAGQDGYFHVGLNSDGTPGEVFINISKAGSTLHGLVDMAATAMSLGLQYGVPLATLLEKFRGVRFEPSGFTGNTKIPRADSIADYFARWMETRFVRDPGVPTYVPADITLPTVVAKKQDVSYHGDPCKQCGNITVRAGSCWACPSCGTTTGCG